VSSSLSSSSQSQATIRRDKITMVAYISQVHSILDKVVLSMSRSQTNRPESDDRTSKGKPFLKTMAFSPLGFNTTVIMLVCITERRSLSTDPLNFSTFNIIFEVIR
jgi:hypothetical protein